ncbi:MAG: glycerol-3-phosphate acyltransferase [Acidimicrobiales bacterium]
MPVVLAVSYLAGSVPVANLAARALRDVDLRDHGNGTVSGTGLYEVAGFGPLAAAGCLELAKGALGPLLAGRRRPLLAGLAAGAAVAGHDWSPFLGWRGGRGLSVAMGACLTVAPEGAALLGAGLAGGRLGRKTGLGCAAAIAALPVVLRRTRRATGLATGLSLAVPLVAKRLAGNERPRRPGWAVYRNRLLFDNDGPHG